MFTNSHSLLTRPLRDLEAWTAHLLAAPIPVLAETVAMIDALRSNEDVVDAHLLAKTVVADPLMTLKLLIHVAGLSSRRRSSSAETVTAALVMLGIPPFFRTFAGLTTVDECLAGRPAALEGFRGVLRCAERAAAFALGFAVHRTDQDAEVLHTAALLHGFAEMLLWLHAPDLACEIAARQATDPTQRSAAVQREVLHVRLDELQQALMRAWSLPELLVQSSSAVPHDTARLRNVVLAIRLARHTAHGWDNPALPDDVADIAALLNLGPEPTLRLLHEIDAS